MRYVVALLCLTVTVVAGSAAAGGRDLLAEGDAWSTWSARPEIEPRFPAGAAGTLTIAGGGNPDACGCWQRDLPELKAGRRYRFAAEFRAEAVEAPAHNVWAIVTRGSRPIQELDYVGTSAGVSQLAAEIASEKDVGGLSLRLCLAWSARGIVRWSGASLTEVGSSPRKPRLVRLAAVSGKPDNPASPADCLDFYCDRLDEAGAGGADLVVLGETINVDGVPAAKRRYAEPIPGPLTHRFAEKARQHGMYIAAGLQERDGPRVYNSSVLIAPSGEIVGKYRKTHLTIGEGVLGGRRPGDEYPVFDTEIGRIGLLICYDNHFPEVARILAVKGAEILAFSNMGDGREGGILLEPYVRVRALDNQVHIAAAVNQGRSMVVSPRGEILDMVDKTPGGIAAATCDLNATVRDYTREEIGRRYLRLRRADTFDVFKRHWWDFK